ncbi:MAG: hypothetical protein WDO14_15895 [Bacteroidota bacterium]
MKNMKMIDLVSSAFLGWWSGMVLFAFLTLSDRWIIVGGFIGAAIKLYEDVWRANKKTEPEHNTHVNE